MRSKDLIDQSIEGRLVQVDLGEDFTYLEVDIPRYSTWLLPAKPGVAPELLALNAAMKATPSKKMISEELTKSDKSAIEKMIQKELKSFAVKDEKDDLKLVKNVLISFVKALYVKRGAWSSDLSGDRST